LQRVWQVASSSGKHRAAIEPLMPSTAGTFFSFHAGNDPDKTAKLQRSLNAEANKHIVQAAVDRMKEQAKSGDKWAWVHHKAVTSQSAWVWKTVRPEDPHSRLSDVEYAIAARLSLGLQPFPARAAAMLPEHCPLCNGTRKGTPVSLKSEPWHWLTCHSLMGGELNRRHNAVVDVIARVAWMVGAQVQREVKDLDPSSAQRPDLQLVFPGRVLLTDVVISHSLTASNVLSGRSTATDRQRRKNTKYARVASRIGAELLNVSVDACGALASDAARLVEAIGEEGEMECGHMEQQSSRTLSAGCDCGGGAARQRTSNADWLFSSNGAGGGQTGKTIGRKDECAERRGSGPCGRDAVRS
jgi:hypothetical protein